MENATDYPVILFLLSFFVLSLSALTGASFLTKQRKLDKEVREDFNIIMSATLTLLGLIIGFSFSMAMNRYDQRKNCEAAETNAIGTEYVRAGLLPASDGEKVRTLLRDYLDQRVLFYTTHDEQRTRQIITRTSQLQNELWSAVLAPVATQPTPTAALAVSGMNDVLNSQAYTQAAWWNRIPLEAWVLMAAIAICCNVLLGYGAQKVKTEGILLLILPLVVAIAFFLIADIDSTGGGVILVSPHNLASLAESLRAH
jgi:hypothetical protein